MRTPISTSAALPTFALVSLLALCGCSSQPLVCPVIATPAPSADLMQPPNQGLRVRLEATLDQASIESQTTATKTQRR